MAAAALELRWEQLTGQDDAHVVALAGGARMHPLARRAFARLHADADAEAGCEIAVASAFRDCRRQAAIWNAKATGRAALLDDAGRTLDALRLPAWERVQAVLRFSALPGASRHHWGSDLDVYDRRAEPRGEPPRLTAAECRERFATLHAWLDARIAENRAHGFFRPYDRDSGGVAVEPWHLSWRPLAAACARRMESAPLRRFIARREDLELRETVLAHWDEVYARFVAPGARAAASPARTP